MDLSTFQNNSTKYKELVLRKEAFIELMKLFVLLSKLKEITFLKYDFKYNSFQYDFTVDSQEEITAKEQITESKYSLILKNKDVIFGKMIFDEHLISTPALKEVLKKIIVQYQKVYDLEKGISLNNHALNIYIVTDEKTKKFAAKMQSNLEILLNANIEIVGDLNVLSSELTMKNAKNIIVYAVQDSYLIEKNKKLLSLHNELVIVIGPNDHDMSLMCGKLNILRYICFSDFSAEGVKELILETKNKLQKKHQLNNKIIAIGGICGGIGTTTVAMNTADVLAHNSHESNVLYIDLSTTKAISNLFLSQNPVPEHTIVDLVQQRDFHLAKNLEQGLVKVRENFYAINGIQKHIDKDNLEKEEFIENFLNYILGASEHFNYIIIDVGISDASPINSTVYDLANEVWILTQLSIPHTSILKTFYSLMKRAGLKEKISFISNQINSIKEITHNDFNAIMSTASTDKDLEIEKVPHDADTLMKSWNYCELASQVSMNSPFVRRLEKILFKKGYLQSSSSLLKPKKNIFPFFRKAYA